ncbi:MAG: DUF3999 family protein, partial [Desulfocapsaceae bacterium]|nr:DUF3999 family protein [Desulfocapsaceae bacterium]
MPPQYAVLSLKMMYLLMLLLSVSLAGQAQAEAMTANDFAAGYYLEVQKPGAVYTLELPDEVYKTVKRADLGDVLVFNASGETVPHSFRNASPHETQLRELGDIPFFPLYQAGGRENRTDRVILTPNGSIVRVEPDPPPGGAERKITGYLLDLSGLRQEARRLDFSWRKDSLSSVYTVHLEQSNDLVHWSPLLSEQTLYEGQQVQRRTIQLPCAPQNYIRLLWQQDVDPIMLTAITGYAQVVQTQKEHQWISLSKGTMQNNEGELTVDFSTGSHFPIDSVQVLFPEPNSIAGIAVQSRREMKDALWTTRCEQVFYTLNIDQTTLQNDPCTFPPSADPHWRLVIKQDGSGLRAGHCVPSLKLGWVAGELLFIGRGNPPFLLAFGSGKLE